MASQRAFEAPTLEAALADVTRECGPSARITQAEKVRTGGFAGFFARERFEVTVEVDDEPGPAPRPSTPAPADPVAPAASLLELADRTSDRELARACGDGPVEDDPPPETDGAPSFADVLRGVAARPDLLAAPLHPDPVLAAPAYQPDPVLAAPAYQPDPVLAAPTEQPTPPDDLTTVLFTSLGIPRDLCRRAEGAPRSIAQRLLAVLEGVPEAPPVLARRGDVVAIVGEEDLAQEAAGVLARQLGLHPADLVVAAPGRQGLQALPDADVAARQRALWRTCGVPLVVAVCPPEGPRDTSWAAEVLAALEPVATWGAVGADRKPEDVAAWAERLGGVDALSVSRCETTTTPAAVLAADIPVAAIEGRRASPAAWTALLVERFSV